MKKVIFGLLLILTCNGFGQKFKGLALTPPMGWNSWNKFGCNISEDLIKQMADAMASNGMKDAGYTYIVIDDCWHGVRDSLGFIHPDPERFPSGMKALADYIHSKGLKFGIYSDAGWKTCGGRPGSRGHEYQDALSYASWGVDYLKYDWCNTEALNAEGAYLTMDSALVKAGRPIVFSLCEWGNNKPWLWNSKIGNLWRTTGDIYPCFDCAIDHGTWTQWGIMRIVDMQKGLRQYAGPGHWNDPDMLEVGNGMKPDEDRAHFSLWCMLAAPLMAGNDIANMSEETKSILTNREAIAVDQDSLGVEALRYDVRDSVEIWFKPLKGDDWAVCFLNRSKEHKKISFNWSTERVEDNFSHRSPDFDKNIYKMRDLWRKAGAGTTKIPLTADIPAHDVLFLRLTK